MSQEFTFTPENQREFEDILGRYPVRRAALLPTLHLAQEQNGFISEAVEKYVASLLEIPLIDVREVLTFYSLFHRCQPGKHHIRVCMSLSCWMRGSEKIRACLEGQLGPPVGQDSAGAEYSWEAVPDCMGACEIAPMIQLDKDYFGNLTPAGVEDLLKTR